MSIFETIRAAVPLPEGAAYYGIEANRSGMARCVFHDDHHPSMKLNPTYFYCFACRESGDLTNLVSRLFGLRPYDAAWKIAFDFGLDPNNPPPAVAKKVIELTDSYSERTREQRCVELLLAYRKLLTEWRETLVPQSMNEISDDRFAEACQKLPWVNYLLDRLVGGSPLEREQTVAQLTNDGWLANMEQRTNQEKEAAQNAELSKAA